jgi:glucose/arabinose dehydrogenase
MDMEPPDKAGRRDYILLAAVGVIAVGMLAWFLLKVQKSIAPAPAGSNQPAISESTKIPELDKQTIIEGLSNVWDVGFLPDSTMLFVERAGTVGKVSDGKKVVLHSVPDVYARGEGGLLGFVVDPDFSKNRYVYACYDTDEDIRVSRWKVNDEVSALTEQQDIVTGMPVNTSSFPGRHSGCRPRFGPDGVLWIGTGDVAVGTNPQDPKSLGGKILRVDRDGKAADGNIGGEFDPRIFSYGHRNLQGLAMLPAEKYGVLGFSVEHGSTEDDEVNPLKSGNMGWNPVPGYNESVPMTDKEKYPDAIEPIWKSGKPTIAPSGATFLLGDKWHAYNGQIAMAVLKGQHLRILKLDEKGSLKDEDELFKNEFGRIRSAVLGPTMDLYLTTDNGAGKDKIIRISPK